jgi:hypothetical protein
MNAIICLALSCLLVGLLYVFMRQQLSAQDKKISDLTQLVVSVASQLQQQSGNLLSPASPPPSGVEVKRLPERVTVSDDSASEGETDSESESDSENEDEEVRKPVEEPELKNTIEVEDISIVLDLNDDSTKTINLFEDAPKPNYEKLTVKDLKELVSKQGGPGSLKTKKELIDYLEKKM